MTMVTTEGIQIPDRGAQAMGYLCNFGPVFEYQNGVLSLSRYNFFFNVGPPKEDIFLTTFYGLYFSSMLHMLQIAINSKAFAITIVNS